MIHFHNCNQINKDNNSTKIEMLQSYTCNKNRNDNNTSKMKKSQIKLICMYV